MRNIFITYGDDRYYFSRRRLAKQARKSGWFDRVKVYIPDDLPIEITESETYRYGRGGGLWIWKPYIIKHALDESDYGDIVWYADSGCSINISSDELHRFSLLLEKYDSLFFAYRSDYDYHWESFGVNSPKLKHWTKPSAQKFLNEYFGSDEYLELPSLWGGMMVFKKTARNKIIDEWITLMLRNPEIVCDPTAEEQNSLTDDFNQHRHDQPIISCVVRKYIMEANALVIDETAESRIGNPAIIAERYRAGKTSFWPDLKTRIYYLFHDR